jgi:hypothetical protein
MLNKMVLVGRLLFLGKASKRMKGQLLESTLFMSKVCIKFYILIEEYNKANNLKKNFDLLMDDNEVSCDIDKNILNEIEIYLN